MKETIPNRPGEACVRTKDGKFSDSAIHEQLTAGTDDSASHAHTRAKLLKAGVPIEDLDRVLPEKSRS